MALALALAARDPFPHPPPATPCCLDRAADARALALVAATSAPAGTLLDVGCGTGEVGLAVLRARPEIDVVGIDVSSARCREAARAARAHGADARFLAIVGSAFDVTLPRAESVVANPPMLPTEPGFLHRPPGGTPELFWVRLLTILAARPQPPEIWLHLFDFHGVDRATGRHPGLPEVADRLGFAISTVHRGWRRAGPSSSITKAMPALRRVFPDGLALHNGFVSSFADLPDRPTGSLATPHSIVHLRRTG